MFQDVLAQDGARVGDCLASVMEPLGNGRIAEGMRYATAGGKRLRAFLVMGSARMFDVAPSQSVYSAAAIEALHAYSLVHDDLPCMDDDDLRRGLPTVHVKWDDATAVLVGDALQTLAFDILTREQVSPDPAVRLALLSSLSRAAGAQGMVLGQDMDIAAETAKVPLNLDQITVLQNNKTGALIEWSAVAGAVLAGQDPTPLRHYARALGLAFQVWDDILDVEGDASLTGKRVGKDADAGKATFVSLLGMDGAKRRCSDLIAEAEGALSPFGARANDLCDAARFVIARNS